MANRRLAAFAVGLVLVLQANPAAADTYVGRGPSTCVAEARFSGSRIWFHHLKVDRNGIPNKESEIVYGPAGDHNGLTISVIYPISADQSVAVPSGLQVSSTVSPRDTRGSFILTIGGQDFNSAAPGVVLTGDPTYRGKAQVQQSFEMEAQLLGALATGGPARLAYVDTKGMPLAEADLIFAPRSAIQAAVEKAYPTALKIVTTKTQC